MQFAVKRHLLEYLVAIRLERCSEVMNIDTAELRHHPVCTVGRDATQPEIVNALLSPAADDVIALGDFFQKYRDICGIVLQVSIHGDDVFAASVIETSSQSRG